MSGAWSISTRSEGGVRVDLAEQTTAKEPRLDLKDAAVADSIPEHRVCNELLHATLVSQKQATSRGRSHGHSRGVRLEVLRTEPTPVYRADHDGGGDERPELLHQVDAKCRSPEPRLEIESN